MTRDQSLASVEDLKFCLDLHFGPDAVLMNLGLPIDQGFGTQPVDGRTSTAAPQSPLGGTSIKKVYPRTSSGAPTGAITQRFAISNARRTIRSVPRESARRVSVRPDDMPKALNSSSTAPDAEPESSNDRSTETWRKVVLVMTPGAPDCGHVTRS